MRRPNTKPNNNLNNSHTSNNTNKNNNSSNNSINLLHNMSPYQVALLQVSKVVRRKVHLPMLIV